MIQERLPLSGSLGRLGMRLPVLELLDLRRDRRLMLLMSIAGLLLATTLVRLAGQPLWIGTVAALALLSVPVVRKWQDDGRRFGTPIMILSILLWLQGFHSIEHIAQWVEYHILGWQAKQSSGLISAANAEWIHFAWNWSVLLVVVYLVIAGRMRNAWAWLLVAWAAAHTFEHSYLFYNYLVKVRSLALDGDALSFAQGLPGILGRGGWIDVRAAPGTFPGFICQLAPPIVTTIRLDIHFWWNVGETSLLVLAAHNHMRRMWDRTHPSFSGGQ